MAVGDSKQNLLINVLVRDQASRELKQVGKEAEGLGKKADKGFKKAARGSDDFKDNLSGLAVQAALTGVALAGVYGAIRTAKEGIRNALEFGEAMSEVRTLLSGSADDVANLRGELLQLAGEYGLDEVDLARSLYQALSAGITDTADAMLVLRTAARLGVAAIGTTSDGVGLLASTFAAFSIDAEDAEQAAELLFSTVAGGVTTLGELSSVFGTVLAPAEAAGLSLKETVSAIAVLTKTSGTTPKAVNQLLSLLTGITSKSEDLTNAFSDVGLEFNQTTIAGSGFASFLRDLKTVVGDDSTALLKLLGSSEALRGALNLTRDEAGAFVAQMRSVEDGADGMGEALGRRLVEPSKKLDIALKGLEIQATKFGVRALEAFGRVFDKVQESDSALGLLDDMRVGLELLADVGFNTLEIATNAAIEVLESFAGTARDVSTASKDVSDQVESLSLTFEKASKNARFMAAAMNTISVSQLFFTSSAGEQIKVAQELAAAFAALNAESGASPQQQDAPRQAPAEPERERAKAVLDTTDAMKLLLGVVSDLNLETEAGIDKDKQAFGDKLSLAFDLASGLFSAGKIGEEAFSKTADAIFAAGEAGQRFFDALELEGLDKLIAKTQQLEDERLSGLDSELRAVDRLIDARIEEAEKAAAGNAAIRENLDEIILGLEAERGIRRENIALVDQETRAQDALALAQDPRLLATEQELLAQALQRTVDVMGSAAIGTQEFSDELRAAIVTAREGQDAFGAGFRDAAAEFVDFSRNDLVAGARLADDMARSLSDSLARGFQDVVTGSKTGSEAFRAFASSVAASMLQIATQALALKAIGGIFGGFSFGDGGGGGVGPFPGAIGQASGGINVGGLSNPVPIKGYAAGGPIFRGPHVAVIGEGKLDEAVVPLPDGRSIPVDFRGLDVGQPVSERVSQTASTTVNTSVSFTVNAQPGQSSDDAARQAITPETMRQIEDSVAAAIASGSNRGLRSAVQGVPR